MYPAEVTIAEMQPCPGILAFWDLESFLSAVKRRVVGAVREIRCDPQAPGKTSMLSSGGSVACMPGLDSLCRVCVMSYLLYFRVCLRLLGSCYNLFNL